MGTSGSLFFSKFNELSIKYVPCQLNMNMLITHLTVSRLGIRNVSVSCDGPGTKDVDDPLFSCLAFLACMKLSCGFFHFFLAKSALVFSAESSCCRQNAKVNVNM